MPLTAITRAPVANRLLAALPKKEYQRLLPELEQVTLPFAEVVSKLFRGTGECAEAGWYFLGLAIPAWTFVFFVAMVVTALVLVRRD